MTTIHLTLDEPLLKELDRAAMDAQLPRSEFIERALAMAVEQQRAIRRGAHELVAYKQHPPSAEELGFEPEDTDWGDEWNPG